MSKHVIAPPSLQPANAMNDKWARILGAPLVAVLMQFVYDGPGVFADWRTLLPTSGSASSSRSRFGKASG